MLNLPEKGWMGKAVQLWRHTSALRISVHAAHACYFMVLAVFPTLVLMLGLLRYSGLQVQTLMALVESFLPQALAQGAKDLILSTYRNSSGTLVSISALTALWSASRGIHGLVTGLNSIYGVTEDRGYVYTRTMSVFYTFVFLVVLQLTLLLHVFGSTLPLEALLGDAPFLQFLMEILDLRFFVLFGLQTVVFTAMFMALPNRKNKLGDSLPGALLASIGWLIFSDLYSTYVERFTGYTNIYGSVYAVALSMLWLYFCISILFYGGALNHWLMDNKEC